MQQDDKEPKRGSLFVRLLYKKKKVDTRTCIIDQSVQIDFNINFEK